MQEKREFPRVPGNIRVEYRIISLGDCTGDYIELRGAGQSDNFSEGGLLFEAGEKIPVDSFLEVKFHVKNLAYPLYLRGRVVRIKALEKGRYDLGIRFTHYFEKDRELLQIHLKDLAATLFSD